MHGIWPALLFRVAMMMMIQMTRLWINKSAVFGLRASRVQSGHVTILIIAGKNTRLTESRDFQDCNKVVCGNQPSIFAPLPMSLAHTVHEEGMPVVLLRFSLLSIAISAGPRQACKLTHVCPVRVDTRTVPEPQHREDDDGLLIARSVITHASLLWLMVTVTLNSDLTGDVWLFKIKVEKRTAIENCYWSQRLIISMQSLHGVHGAPAKYIYMWQHHVTEMPQIFPWLFIFWCTKTKDCLYRGVGYVKWRDCLFVTMATSASEEMWFGAWADLDAAPCCLTIILTISTL